MAGEIGDHDRTADLVRSHGNTVLRINSAQCGTYSTVFDILGHGSSEMILGVGSAGMPRRPR